MDSTHGVARSSHGPRGVQVCIACAKQAIPWDSLFKAPDKVHFIRLTEAKTFWVPYLVLHLKEGATWVVKKIRPL